VKGLLYVVGAAVAAYVAGQRRPATALSTESHRFAELERRLAELESATGAGGGVPELPPPASIPLTQIDKRYTAFHYESLANQAAHERKMAELDWRLAEVELSRHAARAVRCANRSGTTAGDVRNG
jgi:hypothetical protein